MRWMWYGIQPTWLSDSAIFRAGWRAIVPDITQSVRQNIDATDVSVMLAPTLESSVDFGLVDDDPMCMQITVPVSAHAWMNGSQNPSLSYTIGRSRNCGRSL